MPLAFAQDASPVWERFGFKDDSTVKGKLRNSSPEGFSAPPLHWRGFKLYARSDAEETYNDNIYALDQTVKGDFITRVKPDVAVQKEVGRHQFMLRAKGDFKRYAEYSDENIADMEGTLSGRLEAYRSFIIPFEIAYGTYHADRRKQRGGLYADLTRKPVEYHVFNAETGFVYNPNRLTLAVSGHVKRLRYEDGQLNSGAVSIQRDGDNNAHGVDVQLSYDTDTSLTPFLEAKWQKENFLHRQYINGSGFTGNDRSNTMVLARAGMKFDYKGLMNGFISAGQEKRSYTQAGAKDTNAFSLASALKFILSPKWSFNVNASSSTAEDTLIKTGLKKRKFGIGLDYELQQDLFASLGADYHEDEFTSIVRTDKTWDIGGGLRYIVSPRLQLSADYMNGMRDSTAADGDLNNHIFILRVTGAL